MRRHLFIILIVLLATLTACGKKNSATENENNSSNANNAKVASSSAIVESTINAFMQDYEKSSVDFGVIQLKGEQQNIAGIDCMVFNQTAKTPLPHTLGSATAHARSLYIRSIIGCSPSTVEGMTDYETSRRHLNTMWQGVLKSQAPTVKLALQQSNIGKMIETQVSMVANEQQACRTQKSIDVRALRHEYTLPAQMSECKVDHFGVGDQDFVCADAWNVTQAIVRAQGARDDLSYMAELGSRYHRMFLYCSPQDPAEYQAFHRTVPPHLFQAQAYRFRVPIDPIMACHIKETARRRQNKDAVLLSQNFLYCARDFNMGDLYVRSRAPYYLTPDMLGPVSKDPWMYNPLRMKDEPERWNLNDCQKQMINFLAQRGFNIPEPESLAYYCMKKTAEMNDEARKI